MSADLASAKQHLSAAMRHLIRATNDRQPDDPLLGVLHTVTAAYFELGELP